MVGGTAAAQVEGWCGAVARVWVAAREAETAATVTAGVVVTAAEEVAEAMAAMARRLAVEEGGGASCPAAAAVMVVTVTSLPRRAVMVARVAVAMAAATVVEAMAAAVAVVGRLRALRGRGLRGVLCTAGMGQRATGLRGDLYTRDRAGEERGRREGGGAGSSASSQPPVRPEPSIGSSDGRTGAQGPPRGGGWRGPRTDATRDDAGKCARDTQSHTTGAPFGSAAPTFVSAVLDEIRPDKLVQPCPARARGGHQRAPG